MGKYKPQIEVDSAETDPAIPISRYAKKYLDSENVLKHLKHLPEGRDGKKLNEYYLVIAMKSEHKYVVLRKCLECESKIVVWGIVDPYYLKLLDSEKIFQNIKYKVKELRNVL